MVDKKPKTAPFGKAVKDKEEQRRRDMAEVSRPESTFNVQAPTTYSEEPKQRGRIRSFIEDRVMPTLSGSAQEIGSMVLARDISPSEAPRMYGEAVKYNAKQEGVSELEKFVNSAILNRVNKKLPFDLTYSARPTAPAGPRSADTTVTETRGPDWEERARKLGMIK